MELLALPALAICLQSALNLKSHLMETTAGNARSWAIAAIISGCLTVVIQSMGLGNALTSTLQYFTAVMLLTPFVAILGARDPGAKAWPWFVVLPLVLVLQWPSATQLAAGIAGPAIAVPTPTLIGYVVVLLMGAGNYFGTVNTAATMSASLGMLLLVGSVSEFESLRSQRLMVTGYWLLAFSTVLLPPRFRNGVHDSQTELGVEQLWIDFRDIYGIVWAKRVLDRVNQFAERENWNVELSLDGFCLRQGHIKEHLNTTTREIPKRATAILCWVLKRFLNPRFIQRYVDTGELNADS